MPTRCRARERVRLSIERRGAEAAAAGVTKFPEAEYQSNLKTLDDMKAAGPGSGIPDPSQTYLRWLDETGEMGEAELKESRDVDAEKLEDIIKDIEAELKESRDVDAQELKGIIKDIGVEAQKIKDIKDFQDFAVKNADAVPSFFRERTRLYAELTT